MDLPQGISVIAVTGGPCSGKSKGLKALSKMLRKMGYIVLVAAESATRLMMAGASPTELKIFDFQKAILLDTLLHEERLLELALIYQKTGRRVVVLCDRGSMDCVAYMQPGQFPILLNRVGLSVNAVSNHRYHAVIHMRTAALGAEHAYTLKNNQTRKEGAELAREVDHKTLIAWQGHYHLRVIDNSTDWKGKLRRLKAEVCAILGDPVPVEIEKKFLIRRLDQSVIPVHSTISKIAQSYLYADDTGAEGRVRLRENEHGPSYFHTIKKDLPGSGKRTEIDRMIRGKTYEDLLFRKDARTDTLYKRRICFVYEHRFLEVDIFDGPSRIYDLTLLEMEGLEPQEELMDLPFIHVLADVTDDKSYSNRTLAQKVG